MFAGNSQRGQVPFSDFLAAVDEGQVSDVTIQGKNIDGHYQDKAVFSTYSADYPNLVERLERQGVRIKVAPVDNSMNSLFGILLSWFPFILLIGVWFFFMRQMQGGKGGGAMGFGKSKAKMLTEKHGQVTFDDVAGIDEAQ